MLLLIHANIHTHAYATQIKHNKLKKKKKNPKSNGIKR